MLRKLIALMLALLMTAGCALAEFDWETEIPTEPFESEAEWVNVTAVYDEPAELSRYTIRLKDGAPVTAQDLLFSYYVYLDPGYPMDTVLSDLEIPGLESYRLQMSGESLASAREMMDGLAAASAEHEWTEADPWTKELQETYWTLYGAYAAACEAEFPVCAQRIVDACEKQLVVEPSVFDRPVEEIGEELLVAYAMLSWAFADYTDDGRLVSRRTRTVWTLDSGIVPTLEDFVHELKVTYDGDLAACWAVESPGGYEPDLPDWETEFLKAAAAQQPEAVAEISGIRLVDERTVEIALEGVDMRSESLLLGVPMLPLADYGDAELWNPGNGEYGHAFGDPSAVVEKVEADGSARAVQLMEPNLLDSFF